MTTVTILRRVLLGLGVALAVAGAARAADLTVMVSGAFMSAYQALLPGFEKATGYHVTTISGGSTGPGPEIIGNRLARGEYADVMIVSRTALDDIVAKGMAVAGSETNLSRSGLALAVKAGGPKPDISTPAAFKATLLAARSVAFPDSVVGAYVTGDMYKQLGIADQMAAKNRPAAGETAARLVADGQAQFAIQQSSELRVAPGVDVVGYLPESMRRVVVFSAGVATRAKQPDEARKLIAYLASPQANAAITAVGGDPLNGGDGK